MTLLDFDSVQVEHTAGCITLRFGLDCYEPDLLEAERQIQMHVSDWRLPDDLSPFLCEDELTPGVTSKPYYEVHRIFPDIEGPAETADDAPHCLPAAFGSCLAIINPGAATLALLHLTDVITPADLLAAQAWAVAAGAPPVDECWSEPDTHTDDESATYTTYSWE
jgi:hypothetical protein